MFGKRPNPSANDPRIRCTILVRDRYGLYVPCGRLAKRFGIAKYGNDLGTMDLCNNHAAKHRKLGYELVTIDRRRKA